MIDYERIVSDMMADSSLAICFYTKEQCLELRNAIIRAVGSDCIRICWHAEDGNDRGMSAFRLHTDGGKWAINGGSHDTYIGYCHRRFIEKYDVIDDSISEPPSLTMLYGGAL